MTDVINRIIDTVQRVSNDSTVIQVGVAISTLISNFYLPIIPVIAICFGLTVIDLLYGIKVAKIQGVIESRRTWTGTIKKMIDTFTLLTMVRGIELYLLAGITGTVIIGSVATIIGLTELWSILENMNTLNPDGPWRAVSKFMKIKGSGIIGTDIEQLINDNPKQTKRKSKRSS